MSNMAQKLKTKSQNGHFYILIDVFGVLFVRINMLHYFGTHCIIKQRLINERISKNQEFLLITVRQYFSR